MGESIKIDSKVIKEELNTLKKLAEECTKERSNISLRGCGYTAEKNEVCYKKILNIRVALANLIFATITSLEDFQDGYIDTDTYDAQQIQRYRAGGTSE